MVTSNHIHLLVKDTGSNVIAESMQLIRILKPFQSFQTLNRFALKKPEPVQYVQIVPSLRSVQNVEE